MRVIIEPGKDRFVDGGVRIIKDDDKKSQPADLEHEQPKVSMTSDVFRRPGKNPRNSV